VVDRLRVVLRHEGGRAQQVLGLGRVAGLQQAVDPPPPFGCVAAANGGHRQQVLQRAVAAVRRLEGLQQRHDRVVLAHLEPAVGQQQRRSQLAGLGGVQGLELRRRTREVGGLVVREREVGADAGVPRLCGQRLAIGGDRLLVAAERRQRGAQVREHLRVARAGGERLAVGAYRSLEIAGLVQRHGAGERGGRVLGAYGRAGCRDQQEHRKGEAKEEKTCHGQPEQRDRRRPASKFRKRF
jgi:hypothetical protein